MRERQLRGPLEPGGPAEIVVILVRRFLCLACRAVLTVVPREVLCRRLYAATVIGLALALHGLLGNSASGVRQQLCPWLIQGSEATGWLTLRRWVACACAGRLWSCLRSPPPAWSTRRKSAQLARVLTAQAPLDATVTDVLIEVWRGAAHAR